MFGGGKNSPGGKGSSTKDRVFVLLLSIAVTAILDAYAIHIAILDIGSGISYFYPGIAFIVIFGIWFGLWGAAGAYIGIFIGGLITGVDMDILFLVKSVIFFQALVPAIAYRYWNVSSDLANKKSIVFWLLFCVVIVNLIGATKGTIAEGHLVLSNCWHICFVDGLLINITLLPLLMLSFSKLVEESKLYVKGWW